MISDGYIALMLFFVHPLGGVFWLLAVSANVLDADYKGYYVLAMVIFSLIYRLMPLQRGH